MTQRRGASRVRRRIARAASPPSVCKAAALLAVLFTTGCPHTCERHDGMTRNERTVYCLVGFPCPCPEGYSKTAKGDETGPPDFQTKLAATKGESGLSSRFVAMQARRGTDDGDIVGVLPVDLLPGFRVDLTCGIFVDKLSGGVDGGMFGLEILGADRESELYAIYAERSAEPDGLTMRAVTHDGVQGAEVFLAGADKVDLSAFSTGPTITLSYRVAGSPFYSQLAAVNVVSQGPYHPATAIYDVDSKGQVGFSNLDIPLSGVAAKPKDAPPVDLARDKIVQGVLRASSGLARLNSGPPSKSLADTASFDFSGAMTELQSALANLETSEGPSAEKAKKALDKAWRLAGVTGRALGVNPPEIEIPRVLKSFAGKFFPLLKTALENIGRL